MKEILADRSPEFVEREIDEDSILFLPNATSFLMWSFFKKIFRRFNGDGSGRDHSTIFPQGIDKLRDEFASTEELDGPGGPITAREAFELAEEIIREFDQGAKLRSMSSKGKLSASGRSEGWIFDFLLPSRRGTSKFSFNNLPGKETLTVQLTPFAPAGSALDQMLQEGQGGFVEQQWKVELERQAFLSHSFLDSTEVLRKWESEGKSVDYSSPLVLRAVTPPLGKARWELLESPSSKKSLYSLAIE